MAEPEEEYTVRSSTQYKVDASKIEDIEDVREIIDALNIQMTEHHPQFEQFKPYLKET